MLPKLSQGDIEVHSSCRSHLNDEYESAGSRLTPVCVVEEHKAVPLVVIQQAQEGSAQRRPQLQHKLTLALRGETGRDEGDVQGAAE